MAIGVRFLPAFAHNAKLPVVKRGGMSRLNTEAGTLSAVGFDAGARPVFGKPAQ